MPIFGRKKQQQINSLQAEVSRLQNFTNDLQRQASLLNQNKRADLSQLMTKVKELNNTLISVTKSFNAEQAGIEKNLAMLTEFTTTSKLLGESMRRLSALLKLADTDAADIISLVQILNSFESKWGDKTSLDNSQRELMVQEHKAIIQSFNLHNIHARKLEKQLGKNFHSIKVNINGKSIGGDALHNESFHLNQVLKSISEEIQNLSSLNEDILKNSSPIMKGAESIRDFSTSLVSNCQILLSKVDVITQTSQIIQNIDQKIIDIDEKTMQGTHDIHNNGYQRNDDQTSNMYGSWERINRSSSTPLTRRGA